LTASRFSCRPARPKAPTPPSCSRRGFLHRSRRPPSLPPHTPLNSRKNGAAGSATSSASTARCCGLRYPATARREDAGDCPAGANIMPGVFRPLALRARDHTGKALHTLVNTLDDPSATAAAKVSAAIAVLDRGWGKPTERHEHVSLNAVAELSDDELRNAIAL